MMIIKYHDKKVISKILKFGKALTIKIELTKMEIDKNENK